MSSYEALAARYDALTADVDHRRWADYIEKQFQKCPIPIHTVLDLACGTGEMTCLLAERGYEMIGVDQSQDMLAVAAEKGRQVRGEAPIFLQQSMQELDLYGTIDACICCLDSVNYVTRPADLRRAFDRVHLFLMPGGLFLFDVNTPYKHQKILAGQTFDIEAEDADCHWSNRYDEAAQRVDITIDIDYHETGEHFREQFSEYSYALDTVTALLEKYGFAVAKMADGESFGPVRADSPRWIFTAVKQYTQEVQ